MLGVVGPTRREPHTAGVGQDDLPILLTAFVKLSDHRKRSTMERVAVDG